MPAQARFAIRFAKTGYFSEFDVFPLETRRIYKTKCSLKVFFVNSPFLSLPQGEHPKLRKVPHFCEAARESAFLVWFACAGIY